MEAMTDKALALRAMEIYRRFYGKVADDPTSRHYQRAVDDLQKLADMAAGKVKSNRDH